MNEMILLRVSLAAGTAGIIALFFISSSYQPATIRTYDVGKDYENKLVRVKGEISSVVEKGNLILLEIYEPKPVAVVIFDDGKKREFNKGSMIEIIGRVKEYNGKYEVVAEKVK